jgi:putative transposase
VTGWGWFYSSTVLDDFSRYAWKLCTTMKANDVTDTLELACRYQGWNQGNVAYRPRLLSDNGPCYVSAELAVWLDKQDVPHIRGAPYHPMMQTHPAGPVPRRGYLFLLENLRRPPGSRQARDLASWPSGPAAPFCPPK